MAVRTDTNTPNEKKVVRFFADWFEEIPYFRENEEYCGFFSVPEDHIGRSIPWCLLKGEGSSTVVFIHHCDCVPPDDYGGLEGLAHDPYALEKALKEGKRDLRDSAKEDLLSGKWLFGHGVCDMKGGGAIQMALMENYCRNKNFTGNIVLMSLPDEENLSAGMRAGVLLLDKLKNKYGLKYVLMLNSEPHGRDQSGHPAVYEGSVGKLMPVVYVRGKLAHAAQVFQGFNPIALLAEIISRTELEPSFTDKVENTASPPPTWLYAKDSKDVYDVSLPLSACGYMSALNLNTPPEKVIEKLKKICEDVFIDVLKRMDSNFCAFLSASGQEPRLLPWKVKVKLYEEIYEEAKKDFGQRFERDYATSIEKVKMRFLNNEATLIDCVNALIDKVFEYVRDDLPTVVIALSPPYYPSVSNTMLKGQAADNVHTALRDMAAFAKAEFGQDYQIVPYYFGISDLSYAMFVTAGADAKSINCIERNMPLWKSLYYIPLDMIKKLSMPVVNIGPWGKDFHKYTERALKDDLFYKTPRLIDFVVSKVLSVV